MINYNLDIKNNRIRKCALLALQLWNVENVCPFSSSSFSMSDACVFYWCIISHAHTPLLFHPPCSVFLLSISLLFYTDPESLFLEFKTSKLCVYVCVYASVCVCVREREKDTERNVFLFTTSQLHSNGS